MNLIIDGNVILIRSIFARRRIPKLPLEYFMVSQIFKYIKTFDPETVYLVADSSDSWRKIIYDKYKHKRKSFRDSFPDIDWDKMFNAYNKFLHILQSLTPIIVLRIDHLEGDDLIAYLCKYLKKPKIVVTKDKDLTQLIALGDVKIALLKRKGKIEVIDRLEKDIVKEKIEKGDRSDDIPKATTFVEKIRNQILVDLLNLPSIIEIEINKELNRINKNPQLDLFVKRFPYKRVKDNINLLQKLQGGENNE